MSKTRIEGYCVDTSNGKLEISDNKYVIGFTAIGRMQLEDVLRAEAKHKNAVYI